MNRRHLWISLLLIWSLAPMLWQLISSFTTTAALVDGAVPFSQRWTLIHYRQLLSSDPPFWRFLLNSTALASASTVLTILLAIPAAYGLVLLPQRWLRVSRALTVLMRLMQAPLVHKLRLRFVI